MKPTKKIVIAWAKRNGPVLVDLAIQATFVALAFTIWGEKFSATHFIALLSDQLTTTLTNNIFRNLTKANTSRTNLKSTRRNAFTKDNEGTPILTIVKWLTFCIAVIATAAITRHHLN